MYDRGKHAPWWQEAFVLSRAVFGVLFWPLAAIFGLMIAIGGLVVAVIGAAIAVFAWWDRRQPPRH